MVFLIGAVGVESGLLMNSIRVNLYGKPSERLILVGLCEKYNCRFEYDEATGLAFARGDNAFTLRTEYETIINVAYRALAFAQADHKLDGVPNKTLVSEFMESYATITYSLLTGKTMKWYAQTEAQRAGVKAVTKVNGN